MQYIANAYDEALRIVKAVLEIEQEEEYNEVDRDELPIELQATIEEGINEGEQGKGMRHEEMVERRPNSKTRKNSSCSGSSAANRHSPYPLTTRSRDGNKIQTTPCFRLRY